MDGTKSGFSRALRAAFPATVPVMTGYLCLGFAYGVLMADAGYGVGWALLLSVICYAGSMEFVTVSLLTAAFDPISALLMSIMVNARHSFYGLSMLGKYRGTGWARPFLIFSLTDETFSLVSTLEPPEGVERRDFYVWISLLNYSYWLLGSAAGALAGGVLPFDSTGMDFALTALFIVLFLEQWQRRENRPAGLIGIGCTVLALVLFHDDLVIPAMVFILAALLGGRKKLCT